MMVGHGSDMMGGWMLPAGLLWRLTIAGGITIAIPTIARVTTGRATAAPGDDDRARSTPRERFAGDTIDETECRQRSRVLEAR